MYRFRDLDGRRVFDQIWQGADMTVFVTEYMALADSISARRVVRTLAVLTEIADDLVVIGPDIDLPAALAFSAAARLSDPDRSVVLVREYVDAELLAAAKLAGVRQVVQQGDTAALRVCVALLN